MIHLRLLTWIDFTQRVLRCFVCMDSVDGHCSEVIHNIILISENVDYNMKRLKSIWRKTVVWY